MVKIHPKEYEDRRKMFNNSYEYLLGRTMQRPTIAETCIYMQLVLKEDSDEMLKFVLEMERLKDEV